MRRRSQLHLLLALALTALVPLGDTSAHAATPGLHVDPETVATDHGLVLDEFVIDSSDVVSVTGTAHIDGQDYPLPAFALTSGTSRAGDWTTTGPLNLPHGHGSYDLTITDANGATTGSIDLDYRLRPRLLTADAQPTVLRYQSQTVHIRGRLATYDPQQGPTEAPFTTPTAVVAYPADDSGAFRTWSEADGSFDIQATPRTARSYRLLLDGETVDGGPTLTFTTVPRATPARLRLDTTGIAQAAVGNSVLICGTAEFQDTDATWTPLPQDTLSLTAPTGTSLHGGTGTDGRFCLAAPVPTAATTLRADITDPLLDALPAQFTIGSVTQRLSLALEPQAIMTVESRLVFRADLSSSNGTFPNRRVYLQVSPDGHSRWTTAATIPVSRNTSDASYSVAVANPHGWFRLYSPASPGYQAATSNNVHSFRWENRVTGGRPATSRIHPGGTVTVTGTEQLRGYGGWTPAAHQWVYLLNRDNGDKYPAAMARVRTDAHGRFTLRSRNTFRSGTWWVYAPGTAHSVIAYGPQTWVTVLKR